MRQRPVRAAAATSTMAVSFFYLLAQMAGAGGLVALLLGITGKLGQAIVIAVVGALMIAYVLIGGMKGTTWVQIIKAVLLIVGAGVMTLWVLGKFGLNLSGLLGAAVDNAPKAGEKLLGPGLQYGASGTSKLDFLSLALALVLGTAGLPHILMRFYTVPTAKEARRSVVWAIWLIGLFYLFTLVLGYGAAALVGPDKIRAAPGGANSAAPLLAEALGGPLLLGLIAAVAFATILAVVAGLTITASASFAHDIYANIIRKNGHDGAVKGKADEEAEVRVARRTAIVIGIVSILGGIAANGQNIAFLVALAFAVAASANLPTILYSLFWKRFNTSGALWSIYGGLAVTITLIVLSPAVSGKPTSMFPNADFDLFPLSNPGIVSIPVAFLLGYLGTVLSKEHDREKYAEMEVRALTGAGAEKAVAH
jgi:cation/acetate symporter